MLLRPPCFPTPKTDRARDLQGENISTSGLMTLIAFSVGCATLPVYSQRRT
jgi:hypothetical protein